METFIADEREGTVVGDVGTDGLPRQRFVRRWNALRDDRSLDSIESGLSRRRELPLSVDSYRWRNTSSVR